MAILNENTPSATAKNTTDSVYTAAELADNHNIFGTYREIVVVALRQAGKDTATVSEARAIINKFKNQKR